MKGCRRSHLVFICLSLLNLSLLPGCAALLSDSEEETVQTQEPSPQEKIADRPQEKQQEEETPKAKEPEPVLPPTPKKVVSKEALAAERGFYHDSKTNSYFSNGSATFSFRVAGLTNNQESISVSINDEDYVPYTGKLNFEDEGMHRLRFRATDSLGNWSPLQDFKIFIDKTPPVVNAFWQGPSQEDSKEMFVSGLSILSLTAHDANSGVSKIIIEDNGNTKNYTGPMKFNDGKHEIKYYAVDNVGNQSKPEELEFQVDSTPPTTKATAQGGYFKGESETFVSHNAQIILESGESVSGVARIEYTLNNGPITTYHAPLLVTDQKVEIKFRAVDRAGNVEAWKSFNLTPDSTPPSVKLQTHGKYVLKGSRFFALPGFFITVNSKDAGSGISDTLVSQNNKAFEKVNDNKVAFNEPGEYHFSARAVDRVGNVTESKPYVVIIDNEAPESQVRANDKLIFKDGIYYSAFPNHVEIFADDKTGVGAAKIEFSYDGKNFTPYIGSIDVSNWQTPKRTIYFRSTDRLNNIETIKNAVIEIQTEGPQVDLMVESGDAPEVPLSDLVEKKVDEKKEEAQDDISETKELLKEDIVKKEEAKPAKNEEEKTTEPSLDLMVEAPGLPKVPVAKFVEDQKKLEKEQAAMLKKKKLKKNKAQ